MRFSSRTTEGGEETSAFSPTNNSSDRQM